MPLQSYQSVKGPERSHEVSGGEGSNLQSGVGAEMICVIYVQGSRGAYVSIQTGNASH